MIMRAIEHAPTWEEARELLEELTIAVNRFDCKRVIEVLEKAVSEYAKAPQIFDLVWSQRGAAPEQDMSKVAVLAAHRAQKTPPAAV